MISAFKFIIGHIKNDNDDTLVYLIKLNADCVYTHKAKLIQNPKAPPPPVQPIWGTTMTLDLMTPLN